MSHIRGCDVFCANDALIERRLGVSAPCETRPSSQLSIFEAMIPTAVTA
ncbi:MAG: hypothetical protein JWP52_1334, partial [Rhizobacter sp.]|nr:hypothetical protein [Rhizobacter sp.]